MNSSRAGFSGFDHDCMAEALRLAERGLFTAQPNPRVGCVLVRGDRIIGRGWHQRAGGPHAEVAALQDAELRGESARGATAYVTLEPCNHHGRTPPCVDALLQAGIARVVAATPDPNRQVAGGGLKRLRGAGVTADSGLLAAEAEALNCGFFKRARTGLPWLRVKSAVSLDGRTALRSGASKWITGTAARSDVQNWRARSSAILTGIGTVLADDPSLDARVEADCVQPLRAVADTHWRTPVGSRLLREPQRTLIFGAEPGPPAALQATDVECLSLPAVASGVDLEALLRELAGREVNEVQVEAGSRLCGALLAAGLVDEVLLYLAPVLLGDGGPGPFVLGPLESMAERTHLSIRESLRIGDDLRLRLTIQPRS